MLKMNAGSVAEKHENPMSVRSKNALAQSLLRRMMKQNFRTITVTEVTGGAGLSRQTFYTNFAEKEDILNYLLDGLFRRYGESLSAVTSRPDSLIVEYFIFWDKNREFLELIFRQDLGYLFQERNRRFLTEETGCIDGIFGAEPWKLPYIKASLAGLTYELLRTWIVDERGVNVEILTTLAKNFLGGSLLA